jgi:hypothetical protein
MATLPWAVANEGCYRQIVVLKVPLSVIELRPGGRKDIRFGNKIRKSESVSFEVCLSPPKKNNFVKHATIPV